jgi:hypothetical protein
VRITREMLLETAAKAKAEIDALSPSQRALLDMQMAHLDRELARMHRINEAARTSSQ